MHGQIAGAFTKISAEHPEPKGIFYAEAVRLNLQQIDDAYWLTLSPDIWVSPKWAREDVEEFLDKKRGGRYNKQADAILSAWVSALLPGQTRHIDHQLSAFDGTISAHNPQFVVNDRTAYSRRSSL